jgi:hypothetical protein
VVSALQPRVASSQEPSPVPARTGVEHQSTLRPQNDAEVVLLAQRTLAPSPVRPAEFIDTRRAELKQENAHRPAKVAAATAQAVTLDTLAAHAKATHETQRVTAPTASLKPAARHEARVERDAPVDEKRRVKDDAPILPSPVTAQPTPRVEASNEPAPINAPAQVPAAFEPLLAQITDDPSLRISLMPNVARVSIDTGDAGRVSVQVKINDGIAEVRASGPGAPMLEQRQNELRVALAHEGLAMGNFDLTQGGGKGQHERPEPTERDAWTPPRPTLKSRDIIATDGHLHVKA